MKKLGKMNLIFEFSVSKLGYMAIFMKIWEESLTHFFKTFLTNQGKNEDLSNRKCDKISLIFEFSISKLGYMGIFMKIREKKFDPFF